MAQAVRQCIVKTADDRLATIWSEMAAGSEANAEQLQHMIQSNLMRHGRVLRTASLGIPKLAKSSLRPSFEPGETIFGY